MKRTIALLLTFILLLGLLSTASAVGETEGLSFQEAAEKLYSLGLFKGVGNNADGSPNFDLDRAPNRAEAVTMLVRLLGKESEAQAGTWQIPFTDVVDWAKPYVGYAYVNKLTNGVSATEFDCNSSVSATQYLTFVLRALGYSSDTDFQWNKAWELANTIGLTNGEYDNNAGSFLRGNVAKVSCKALEVKLKNSDQLLEQTLALSPAGTQQMNTVYNYLVQFVKDNGTAINGLYSYSLYKKEDSLSINDYQYVDLIYDEAATELKFVYLHRYTEKTLCLMETENGSEMGYLWHQTKESVSCPEIFGDYSQYKVVYESYTPAYSVKLTRHSALESRVVCDIVSNNGKYDTTIVESTDDYTGVIAGMNIGAQLKKVTLANINLALNNILTVYKAKENTLFGPKNNPLYPNYEKEIPEFFNSTFKVEA